MELPIAYMHKKKKKKENKMALGSFWQLLLVVALAFLVQKHWLSCWRQHVGCLFSLAPVAYYAMVYHELSVSAYKHMQQAA